MPDVIVENWPLKVISLVVAILLWFYVLGTEDPQTTQAVSVSVVPVNVPADLKPIDITPGNVELRLRGRESALEQLQTGRIRMEASLRNGRVGRNQVPMRVAGVPLALTVVPGYPATATVQLDQIIERTRPVHDITRGEPASGFVVDSVAVQPREVTIRGATSRVREVARVVVVVDVSGFNRREQFEAEVEARDNRNVVVSGIEFDPSSVTVTVSVSEADVKMVPVRVNLGSPPAGYRVVGVSTDPEWITVTGEKDLSRLESVSTLGVDISGLRGTKSYSVPLNVPPDLRVPGAASVQVTVTTRPTTSPEESAPGQAQPGSPEPEPETAEGEDIDAPPGNQGGEDAAGDDPGEDDAAAAGGASTPSSSDESDDSDAAPQSDGSGT